MDGNLREHHFEKLIGVFAQAPVGLCCFDENLRYIFINDYLAALNGKSVEEHLGRSIHEVIPDVAAGVEAQLRSVIETGEPVIGGEVDAETPAHPGLSKSFRHHYYAIKSEADTDIAVACVVREVTERKQAEEALDRARSDLEHRVEERTRELSAANRVLENEIIGHNRSQDLYKTLLNTAPDPIVTVDRVGKIVVANNRVERVFGYSSEELIGQSVEILLPENLRDRHIRHRNYYLSKPQIRPMGMGLELVAQCKDGRELPVEISLSPVQGTESLLVTAVIRDISERKKAELVFRNHQEHLQLLLETTPAIPWETDAKTWKCTYVGPQAVELLGYPRGRWLEKNFWADHLHPEDRARAVEHGQKSLSQNENYEFEYRMIAADGRTVWIQDIITIVRQDGVPVILRGFIFDITARKQAEEELQDLNVRLINAYEEERRKISRELHDDFGQRLALLAFEIQRFGQKMSEPEFESAEGIDKLWSQTNELSTDLHRLSRQLHPAILDQLGLGPAIKSLCNEISQQHGIQIEFTEHEIPESVSRDIALCLYRTVQEGLRNIVKHSGAKDAKVELTGNPDTIRLRITDRGIGFNPETTKRKGLGLISIEERVRLVQGEISLQSQPSQGTSIDLRVPLAAPDT